jgi:polyphosphate kinase 2 (PPK2 family)
LGSFKVEIAMKKLARLAKPYRIEDGRHFRLKDFDPGDTGEFRSKEHAQDALEAGVAQLRDLQDKLYAQERWAVLLILQGMDAAGKDSVIKHVISGINPRDARCTHLRNPPKRN